MANSYAQINSIDQLKRIEEERLAQKKAKAFNLEYAYLDNYPVAPEILHFFDKTVFANLRIIPYLKAGEELKIAITEQLSQETLEALLAFCQKNRLRAKFVLVSESSFKYLEEIKKSTEALFEKFLPSETVTREAKVLSIEEFARFTKESSVTEIVDKVLIGALELRASDIHIEPKEKEAIIRLRIDGVLHEAARLSKEQFRGLLSRIKVLAGLKIENIPHAQDGHFSFNGKETNVDIRVSTLPSIYGESIVLRLLEQNKKFQSLKDLGFREEVIKNILISIKKPYGLILVTGPTGSGKTTTLYAILKELNRPERKIITLEDPVEYRIPGIVQCQVNENLSFVDGLKGALRQDPDIILVGEIRDLETASIAINASLTGHLLLSTLHTNNAPAALARLIELGVPPFLLSGSINLILAQRLVRKLCESCKIAATPNSAQIATFRDLFKERPLPKQIFQAGGCPRCNGTGYFGRIAIAEALIPSLEIERLILMKASLRELEEEAKKEGMFTMEQDGFLKVLEGVTSFEEVLRVIKE